MTQFSVLMSIYEKENDEYFDCALNSLALQTCPANEIVLVVDGYISGKLYNIIKKWEKTLPLVIIALPTNVGLGNALRIGLERTSFDIIARMDTDDICLPNRFEKQISYFDKNPDTALLGGAIIEYDDKLSKENGIRFSCNEHNDIVKYSIARNPFNHMTMMFRKNVVLSVGSYQHHGYMEDYNLWLRCISVGAKCHNLSDVLVHARTGPEMISRRRGISYIKSEYKLALLKIQCFPKCTMKIISVTIIRILTRGLPVRALSFMYKLLRT